MEERTEDGLLLFAYKSGSQGPTVYGRATLVRYLLRLAIFLSPHKQNKMSTPDATVPIGGAVITPGPYGGGEEGQDGGRRTRRGASVKQLKKMLKKAGLKTTGKKASLTKRAKKAHLKLVKKGGEGVMSSLAGRVLERGKEIARKELANDTGVGGRRRSRRSRGFRLF